jgi:hypothetical protein
MVGDLAACRRALDELSACVEALRLKQALSLTDEGALGQEQAWKRLVPRFRALRESLTRDGDDHALTLAAYELAGEACLRAGDLPEALKAVQRLVRELYPLAAARSSAASIQKRWAEAAACALLFFAHTSGERCTALRDTPKHLLRTPAVRSVVQALGCLARGDHATYCRALSATPLLVRLLAVHQLNAARCQALFAFSRAYRSLPVAVVESRLGVQGGCRRLISEAAVVQGAPRQLAVAAGAWTAEAPTADLVFA